MMESWKWWQRPQSWVLKGIVPCSVVWISSLQGSQLPCCEGTQAAVKGPCFMEPRPPDIDSKYGWLKLGGAGLVVKIRSLV